MVPKDRNQQTPDNVVKYLMTSSLDQSSPRIDFSKLKGAQVPKTISIDVQKLQSRSSTKTLNKSSVKNMI